MQVPLELPGHVGERTMSLESTIMTLAVLAKSFTAISPVTGVLAELPELLLLPSAVPSAARSSEHAARLRRRQQRAVRTGLLWGVAAAAYPCSVSDGLALVEAVTGAMCSMLASIGIPCACWVALYRHEVPPVQALAAAALALVAALAGAAMTAIDLLRYFGAGAR